jgi:hypothetical protein
VRLKRRRRRIGLTRRQSQRGRAPVVFAGSVEFIDSGAAWLIFVVRQREDLRDSIRSDNVLRRLRSNEDRRLRRDADEHRICFRSRIDAEAAASIPRAHRSLPDDGRRLARAASSSAGRGLEVARTVSGTRYAARRSLGPPLSVSLPRSEKHHWL